MIAVPFVVAGLALLVFIGALLVDVTWGHDHAFTIGTVALIVFAVALTIGAAFAIFLGPSDAERLRDCLDRGGQWVQVNRNDFSCVDGGR